MSTFSLGPKLKDLVEKMVESYEADTRTQYLNRTHLPSRREIVRVTEMLLELTYPGFIGRQNLTHDNVQYHVGELLPQISDHVYRQVRQALCYREECEGRPLEGQCAKKAHDITMEYLEGLPSVREMLAGDVQAAFDGDPAAINTDEIILAYPGFMAISVHRLAHELYRRDVPLMPRIMSEWAHSRTGIDIHPGAQIGRNFFIDHGTGVVIGETTVIGDNVKIYQGVTLGALSFPKDERGRVIRGYKRHPTVRESVTLYANAIVLGGDTVVGEGSVIGGSVFLTGSVPPNHTVLLNPPDHKLRSRQTLQAHADWQV